MTSSTPFKDRLKRFLRSLPLVRGRNIRSIVYAPPGDSGGVKSLYLVCDWLNRRGRSAIAPFDGNHLVTWFAHNCRIFDRDYTPQVVVYPEIFQPRHGARVFHICFALGRFKPIEPHADLVVVKSSGMFDWVKQQQPQLPIKIIRSSITRSIFEYDGRPKKEIICYMTRAHKSPETAALLRERYGDKIVEIVGKTETEVAEILKSAKVFVWRGYETEGSPRPPKEALVAGCVVVGLAKDLRADQDVDFGVKCRDVKELLQKAGEALQMPVPSPAERAVVRDAEDEARDWLAMMKTLKLPPRR